MTEFCPKHLRETHSWTTYSNVYCVIPPNYVVACCVVLCCVVALGCDALRCVALCFVVSCFVVLYVLCCFVVCHGVGWN